MTLPKRLTRRKPDKVKTARIVDPNFYYKNKDAPLWPVKMRQIHLVRRPIFEIWFLTRDNKKAMFRLAESDIDEADVLLRKYRENNANLPNDKKRVSAFIDYVQQRLMRLRSGFKEDIPAWLENMPTLQFGSSLKDKPELKPLEEKKPGKKNAAVAKDKPPYGGGHRL